MSDPYLNCEHCGDQCACRATRDDLNKAIEIIRELLSSGKHEGACTNEGFETDDGCELAIAASKQRHQKAKEFLDSVPKGEL